MKPMATPEILVRARNAFKMGEFPLVEKLALRILEAEPDSAVRDVSAAGQRVWTPIVDVLDPPGLEVR